MQTRDEVELTQEETDYLATTLFGLKEVSPSINSICSCCGVSYHGSYINVHYQNPDVLSPIKGDQEGIVIPDLKCNFTISWRNK